MDLNSSLSPTIRLSARQFAELVAECRTEIYDRNADDVNIAPGSAQMPTLHGENTSEALTYTGGTYHTNEQVVLQQHTSPSVNNSNQPYSQVLDGNAVDGLYGTSLHTDPNIVHTSTDTEYHVLVKGNMMVNQSLLPDSNIHGCGNTVAPFVQTSSNLSDDYNEPSSRSHNSTSTSNLVASNNHSVSTLRSLLEGGNCNDYCAKENDSDRVCSRVLAENNGGADHFDNSENMSMRLTVDPSNSESACTVDSYDHLCQKKYVSSFPALQTPLTSVVPSFSGADVTIKTDKQANSIEYYDHENVKLSIVQKYGALHLNEAPLDSDSTVSTPSSLLPTKVSVSDTCEFPVEDRAALDSRCDAKVGINASPYTSVRADPVPLVTFDTEKYEFPTRMMTYSPFVLKSTDSSAGGSAHNSNELSINSIDPSYYSEDIPNAHDDNLVGTVRPMDVSAHQRNTSAHTMDVLMPASGAMYLHDANQLHTRQQTTAEASRDASGEGCASYQQSGSMGEQLVVEQENLNLDRHSTNQQQQKLDLSENSGCSYNPNLNSPSTTAHSHRFSPNNSNILTNGLRRLRENTTNTACVSTKDRSWRDDSITRPLSLIHSGCVPINNCNPLVRTVLGLAPCNRKRPARSAAFYQSNLGSGQHQRKKCNSVTTCRTPGGHISACQLRRVLANSDPDADSTIHHHRSLSSFTGRTRMVSSPPSFTGIERTRNGIHSTNGHRESSSACLPSRRPFYASMLNTQFFLPDTSPYQYFPDYCARLNCRILIINQPEHCHRARYQTEGSRGAVKDRSGLGYPQIELRGWNERACLQVFVGTESGRPRPHPFYQTYLVPGRSTKCCLQTIRDGVNLVEMPFICTTNSTLSVECIGIMKLRRMDVEHRSRSKVSGSSSAKHSDGLTSTQTAASNVFSPAANQTANNNGSNRKLGKGRLIFRAILFHKSGIDIVQVASEPISCTQIIGDPEITCISLSKCSTNGGKDLFILGKHFVKECRVLFCQPKNDSGDVLDTNSIGDVPHNSALIDEVLSSNTLVSSPTDDILSWYMWQKFAEIDIKHSQTAHLVCRVPAYDGPSNPAEGPISVQLLVICGQRYSNTFSFSYTQPSSSRTCSSNENMSLHQTTISTIPAYPCNEEQSTVTPVYRYPDSSPFTVVDNQSLIHQHCDNQAMPISRDPYSSTAMLTGFTHHDTTTHAMATMMENNDSVMIQQQRQPFQTGYTLQPTPVGHNPSHLIDQPLITDSYMVNSFPTIESQDLHNLPQ